MILDRFQTVNELEFLAENLRFSKACYHQSRSRTPTHPPRAGILHRSINRSWTADSPVQRMGYQTTLLVQSPYYTQDLFTKNSDVHSRNFPFLNKNLACPKYERNRKICDNNKSQIDLKKGHRTQKIREDNTDSSYKKNKGPLVILTSFYSLSALLFISCNFMFSGPARQSPSFNFLQANKLWKMQENELQLLV